MDTLPEGRLVKIAFEIRLPATATLDQIDDWIAFQTGAKGNLALANPLRDFDLEVWRDAPALTDTGMNGRVEEFGHRPTEGGGTTYTRRYIREHA
jgi:hypothetical protein